MENPTYPDNTLEIPGIFFKQSKELTLANQDFHFDNNDYNKKTTEKQSNTPPQGVTCVPLEDFKLILKSLGVEYID